MNVNTGEEGVYERFGKYVKTVKAGMHYFNPCTDKIRVISKRVDLIDLPKQMLLTKDNIVTIVDGVVYYKIGVARKALYSIANIR